MRKTKIVCTLGPASSSPEVIRGLLEQGMDVARINMSHGTWEGHAKVIRQLRREAKALGRNLAILQDLQGPKIRVGNIRDNKVHVRVGDPIILSTKAFLGDAARISTSYIHLPQDVSPGDPILIDDGKVRLRVKKVLGSDVHCQVEVGGVISNHKGINLPGVSLSTPSVTAKDMADLRFGVEQGVDYVALSFVRHPDDVVKVKSSLKRAGRNIPVISKIEKPEALEHLRGIMRVSEGIMVARGDLGVELEAEKVPLIQKDLIAMANESRILVITATQMLESMTDNATPTRAEASDVFNAIIDGTDAVMLSGETAAGKYPIEAVAMMARICESAEGSSAYRDAFAFKKMHSSSGARGVAEAVAFAARAASEDLRVRAVLCFTQSGSTARLLSKFRPEIPIYAFTPELPALRQMGLVWGTLALPAPRANNTDRLIEVTCRKLRADKRLSKGDSVIVISGTPLGESGTINMMKIHKVS